MICGCSVLIDNEIKYAASEERFTRKKGDEGYAYNAINDALNFCNLKPNDIDHVIIAGNQYNLSTVLLRIYSSFSVKDQLESMEKYWHSVLTEGKTLNILDVFKEKLDLDRFPFNQSFAKELDLTKLEYPPTQENYKTVSDFWKKSIATHLDIDISKITHMEHESCHASYALYGSPFRENTIIFTADSWGDDLAATISVYDKSSQKIRRVKAYSDKDFVLAKFYRFCTLYLRLLPNSHEYKLMGLAPYYNGPMVKEVEKVFSDVQILDGLEFKCKKIPNYFEFIEENLKHFRFDHIAAGVQSFIEKMLVRWIKTAIIEFGGENVVFSGGISNNVKANMQIHKIPEVKNFFVCGSGGDESLSMGACYAYAESLELRPKPLRSLYLGSKPDYSENDLSMFKKYQILQFNGTEQILEELLDGKIVATCRGRMEMGQRALGNRSIISDPRNRHNIQKINRMIKNRDFWMPFAPIILEEYQDELIINPKKISSPFMTIAFDTVDGDKNIPSAIHQYDKTCRPQILEKSVNPILWQLIKKFYESTKIPALLNTSFNLHGEPIVRTVKDALHVFENSGLDVLWLENHIIKKI
jgi:carbamoyltransferase